MGAKLKLKRTVTKLKKRLTSRGHYYVRQLKSDSAFRRSMAGFAALLFIFAVATENYLSRDAFSRYDISRLERVLLEEPVALYDQKLTIDTASNRLVYNEGYQPAVDVLGQSSAPKFTAVFDTSGQNSVEITDIVNQVNFTMKPKFRVNTPQKNLNRVVYPIVGKNATKIYTLKGSAIKEDLVLFSNQGNSLEFDYELILDEGTQARIESDGSVGVYGAELELLGNVTTSTESDADLLARARERSPKTNLLFTIPAPFIVEAQSKTTEATAWFSLHDNGTTLRVHADNLDQASYPLSIDPSVYIETARKLMRGNNESNIDFNITNELIQKGSTTGGRFDTWDETLALNEGRWNGASAVSGGFIYYVGGASEGGIVKTVYDTAGSDTFTVPAGITQVSIKAWGGGGGGGGAGVDRVGGNGGGGGYASSTVSVTPAESLTVRIGGAGGGGTYAGNANDSGNGGGGGGYSGVLRSTTPIVIAGGGGGGGGGNGHSVNPGASTSRTPGSAAGAGGGTTGLNGSGNGTTTGGGGGTQVAGGAGGTVGGVAGSSLTGGAGGSAGAPQANGGVNGGGNGGTQQNGGGPNKYPGGGGGGGGYFGAGGGGQRNDEFNGGAGGGGGSSYTTGSPATNASGTGINAANFSDADRNGAAQGGGGGAVGASGSAGAGGLVVITYATGGGGAVNDNVYWAQLNETTGSIENANPGNGVCVNWCTLGTYSLPEERQAHSMVSYNGYLYVIGGEDDNGVRKNTVLISKLGVNGEPSLWHPTDPNQNNWVYWYEDTTLPSERSYHTTVVYNNKIYLLGGQTNASPGGVTSVHVANIEPTGTLDAWTTSGTTVLPSARFGHDSHVYNDYLYVIGGNSSGTLQSSVQFIKLSDNGAMSGAWQTTTSFETARMAWGGTISTIWGGYLYISGGCEEIDGSGYCTTVSGDVQLASINADGTLSDWGEIIGLSNLRFGHSFIAWRNSIYGIGGCLSQNPTNGQCLDLILTNDKGVINQDGDASTVSNSVTSGVAPCTGADPFDCDIPPIGDANGQGGQMAGGAVVNNGFVYYIGGCRISGAGNLCSQGGGGRTASSTSYAAIATDGTLRRATCTGTNKQYYGSWCVDNANRINSGNGLAAFGFTVFNNTIYAIGGTTGAAWQANVWRTNLAADGSLGTWASQSFTDTGLGAAKGYQYVFSRANPSEAGSFPGNLYVIGGCNGTVNGLDCNDTIYNTVYKCKIATSGALGTGGDACTTSGQLQIDSEPNTAGNQGLGIMAGTVYANYIYLIGGQSDNEDERGQVMYARIDNSNNIVAVSGGIWLTSENELSPPRRRGVAFGYNGYLYGLAGFADDTGLQDLLFAKINVSDGSIGQFKESLVTVNPRWDLRAVVSSGYVYTLGGCSSGEPPATCLAMTPTVQTFQLYNNYSGSNAEFITASNLFDQDRFGTSAAVVDGYMYVSGGCTNSTCTATTSGVRSAQLNTDGSFSSWSNITTMPNNRAFHQLEAVDGSLYAIGGQANGGTPESTVFYATPSAGTIPSWSTATNGLPAGRTEHSAAVWNNRIYVVGGRDGSGTTNSVYYSPELIGGGDIMSAWSTSTAFTTARSGHTAITYAGNLYILGGHDGANYLNDVQYAKINTNGTVGSWSFTTSLPQRIRNADGFAANGYMYLFGGRSADTTCTANAYIAPVSANTTIASGNNPTGLGDWYQTRSALNGIERYGAAAVYSEGKAYVMGGVCGTSFSGSTRVQYATLLSQPQIARYSRMIDTDSDVFPTKWLMNGLDNDIGARWYVRYRSSTDSANEWGQETDFGTVNLGNVEDYIPLNDIGGNTSFARYYYFSISINSSQAYGYPDDVTRGPTINDLTLFFTSDPNKRLRHGKTFTGGEQQPLDTPPPN